MKWSTSAQLYKSRTNVKSNDHRLADMARLTLAFLTQLPSEGQQVATAMVTRSTQPRKCTANTQLNHEPEQPATMLTVDDVGVLGSCLDAGWALPTHVMLSLRAQSACSYARFQAAVEKLVAHLRC